MSIAYIVTLDPKPGIDKVPRDALASLGTASLGTCFYMHLYSTSVDRRD